MNVKAEQKLLVQSKKNKKKVIVNNEKPKSAYALFRERYPEGIGYIVNMQAVLR